MHSLSRVRSYNKYLEYAKKMKNICANQKKVLSLRALTLKLVRVTILGGGRSFRFNGRTLRVLRYALPIN